MVSSMVKCKNCQETCECSFCSQECESRSEHVLREQRGRDRSLSSSACFLVSFVSLWKEPTAFFLMYSIGGYAQEGKNIFQVFVFGSTGDGTQGLTHARQVL